MAFFGGLDLNQQKPAVNGWLPELLDFFGLCKKTIFVVASLDVLFLPHPLAITGKADRGEPTWRTKSDGFPARQTFSSGLSSVSRCIVVMCGPSFFFPPRVPPLGESDISPT